ncbi:hypothetical protein Nepgr_032106 [Nepenthes gracilis]|uniref:Uncharacterized protein n=1 Tax=Nepenthes gracilis TaxID=150966 RepID=A0AAD3TJU7_NEPGR|nr:hypothetical protein Nepgr_032106 [Nepenthes gracilis]
MKKLYRKGAVHPSPPFTEHLSYLPAAIVTLTAALTAEDREVLAYLISCSENFPTSSGYNPKNISAAAGKKTTRGGDHPPSFRCSCFWCYMSYWVRWDSSPNRQLIHEIIDAFEDGLAQNGKKGSKRDRKKKLLNGSDLGGEVKLHNTNELTQSESVAEGGAHGMSGGADSEGGVGGSGGGGGGGEDDKGSVRKLMSFIEEKIWGFWGVI